ncbi:MAG TPA: PhoH family protein, partial [Melioribacteraceae bacterium]|nr:PhoH family protein [Melioribacteraceae bacterium]
MQIEKVLKLEGVDLLLFLGINDSNLKLIEKKFNTNLTVRGDNIYLKGEVEEVNIVEHIFKEMIYVLNTTGRLRISDIET